MALFFVRLGILAAVVALFVFAGVIAYYRVMRPGLRHAAVGLGALAAGLYGASVLVTIILQTASITAGP